MSVETAGESQDRFVVYGTEREGGESLLGSEGTLCIIGLSPPEDSDDLRYMSAGHVACWTQELPDEQAEKLHRFIAGDTFSPIARPDRAALPDTIAGSVVRDSVVIWANPGPVGTVLLSYAKRGHEQVPLAKIFFEQNVLSFYRLGRLAQIDLSAVVGIRSVGVFRWNGEDLSIEVFTTLRDGSVQRTLVSTRQMRAHMANAQAVITDNVTGVKYYLGQAGVEVKAAIAAVGALPDLLGASDADAEFTFDLPLLLPLEEGEHQIVLRGSPSVFVHQICKRGQQEFSSLDTTLLPRFSRIKVPLAGYQEHVIVTVQGKRESVRLLPSTLEHTLGDQPVLLSYAIIRELLERVLRLPTPLLGEMNPLVSYRLRIFRNGARVAECAYPLAGRVPITQVVSVQYERERWAKLLASATELRASASAPEDLSFSDRCLAVLHSFCAYVPQHPAALAELKEEALRDLLLLVFKSVFGFAEGEVFHYDGKLDFKVCNPRNSLVFVTGELKIWSGAGSMREVLEQALRKHANGREDSIFVLLICDVARSMDIWRKAIKIAAAEPQVRGEFVDCAPPGSKELAARTSVEIRGRQIPLYLLLVDRHHAPVRARPRGRGGVAG